MRFFHVDQAEVDEGLDRARRRRRCLRGNRHVEFPWEEAQRAQCFALRRREALPDRLEPAVQRRLVRAIALAITALEVARDARDVLPATRRAGELQRERQASAGTRDLLDLGPMPDRIEI